MVTYNLILSQVFPSWHFHAGQPTRFIEQLRKTKLHTMRANEALWRKRFEKINAGKAELSIRVWLGKPYRSKTMEIVRLGRDSGIGMQTLVFDTGLYGLHSLYRPVIDGNIVDPEKLAANDGLSFADWLSWFQNYDICKPLVVLQFTSFRY